MICRTFCLMLVVGSCLHVRAQESVPKQQPAHIGFSYPISSNGSKAADYSNNFSLHALTGVSRDENGLAIAGIALIVKDSVNGAQFSGILNRIGKNAHGVQLAGIANTMKNSYGLAAAGVVNKASGNAEMQLAGITNMAFNVDGMQIAGIANLGRNIRGMQVGGIVNIADSTGNQVAGIFNRAGNVRGIQVAGIANKAAKVKGVQVAGILNIADSSDYPIGLVNIIKNGHRYISVSIDESATMLTSFRSGGRVLYGIVGLGYNVRKDGFYAAEAGVGANLLQRGSFGLQAEVAGVGLFDFKGGDYCKSVIRVLPSWSFSPNWRVWGGPTFAHITTDMPQAAALIAHPIWEKVKDNRIAQLAWGLVAGVQVKL